ncbi:MAG: hypothetical protein ACLQUR_01525, partial [Limisphaerales bacterium]
RQVLPASAVGGSGSGLYGGGFVLSWPFGTLDEATNLNGPWTPVESAPANSGATYTNIIDSPEMFFKVSNP